MKILVDIAQVLYNTRLFDTLKRQKDAIHVLEILFWST